MQEGREIPPASPTKLPNILVASRDDFLGKRKELSARREIQPAVVPKRLVL